MAIIYLSYSHKDGDFARLLIENLRSAGHQILADTEILAPGQNWRSILSESLKSADAFVVLLSEWSLASQYTLMEVGSARAYASEIGKPLIIPVLIDDVPIPPSVGDIQAVFALDRNIGEIVLAVGRALFISAGREAAKEKKEEETARKIESISTGFIDVAINTQRKYQTENNIWGLCWYVIGFLALVVGIGFALISLQYRTSDPNWLNLVTILVTNVIVIGFLGACSRYAFSLGKSYISESLKAADRIHAIRFGQFYLQAFGTKANWSELKEVFQYWNIDRSSTFSTLDASQIDPQILSLIGSIATVIGTKGKDKDK
jgi:hypothetical protein